MLVARSLAVLVLACSASAQGRVDVSPRSWSQAWGNALGTSFVDVEAVRSAPEELGKLELGTILGEPVIWDGIVFVLIKSEGTQLRAYEVATRKLVKSTPVTGDVPSALFTWNWRVGAVTQSDIGFFDFQREGKSWTAGARLAMAGGEAPRVWGNLLFAAAPTSVTIATVDKAAVRTSFEVPRGPSALRPPSAFGPAARATLLASGGKWSLRVVELDELDSIKLKVLGSADVDLGAGPDELPSDAQIVRLQPVGGAGAWLVSRGLSSQLVVEGAQTVVLPAPFVGPVGAIAGAAFGFDSAGALMRMESSGSVATVSPATPAPRGLITLARDVAYTAGRAIDLKNGKELWAGKRWSADRRAYPAADQRLVLVDGKGSLVFLGPKASQKNPALSASAVAPPGSGDGVVKADGSRVLGRATRVERGWRIEDEQGGLVAELGESEVALVEREDSVELVGPELAVHRAWRAALDVDHRARLVEGFQQFMKQRLVEDAQRLLGEAKACGLERSKLTELEALLAKTKPNENSNKESQRKAPLAKEAELRKASRAAFTAAAQWCGEHQLALTASMLLLDGEKLAPAEGSADAALVELIPEAFPWRDASDAAARWKTWVPQLLPSNAAFVPKSDPIWKHVQSAPWDKGVVVVQSPHVLLCSRDQSPEIIGGCLDAAEEAMRLLHGIVPPEEGAPSDPLIVRLLYDKQEYMAERAPDFTLGYYSPGEKVSRFFVPRGDEGKDLLGRGLFSTVAHELTHHYLDVAWLGPATERKPQSSSMPGYWIVEGFATFVQDDVVAKIRARGGLRPQDPACAYVTKAAHGNGHLMPFAKLLELTQAQFQKLGKEPLFDVPGLTDTAWVLRPAEVNVFYQQSAALVFFLKYKSPPERRAKLAEYVRAQYLGALGSQGWKALGYGTAEELDQAFRVYLQSTGD